MTIFELEHQMIDAMNKVVDDQLKIEWHQGGSDIRRVMLDALNKGFVLGKEYRERQYQQEHCKHDIDYNIHGGKCRLCGYNDLRDSSD